MKDLGPSVARRTLCALALFSLARCGMPVDPGADAGTDARRDTGSVTDSGVVEDTGVLEDTGAPADVPTADSGVVADVPSDVPSCMPRCEGRVCGDDGCGGVCGMCGGGATCTAMGTCTLAGMMGGGQWSITAVEGDVSARNGTGGEWDVGINMTFRLPDPKVCITVGTGREECSGFINNTIAPSWNYRFPSGVDTAQLTGGMLRVRLADDDTAFDDTICAIAPAMVTMAQVTAGRFEFRCMLGGVTFRLTAR
ncbi:MAG: hypothetical protein JNK05_34275 [Myxococcales bacterium]|nr:hypothetical protein [Myxococcales bacterium]